MKKKLKAIAADESLVSALKGSLIGEILEAMLAGLSEDLTEIPLAAPGDKVVREMNVYEKAVEYLHEKYRVEGNAIAERLNGDTEEYFEAEEGLALLRKMQNCRNKEEACRRLRGVSFFSCLADGGSEFTGVKICKGGQLALTADKPKRECSPSPLETLLGLVIVSASGE